MSDDLISRKTLIEEIMSFRCSLTGLRSGKGMLALVADQYRFQPTLPSRGVTAIFNKSLPRILYNIHCYLLNSL